MASAFYIIDLVVNGLIFLGFSYRYHQTKVKYYLWLAVAVLASAVASALLAFLTGIGNLSAIVIYVSLILVTLAGLIFIMAQLYLLRDWIQSMRRASKPEPHKLEKADKLCNALKYTYPALTLLLVLAYVLLIVFLTAAGIIVLLVALMLTVAIVLQLGVMVWLWLDVQSVGSESMIRKRNQLVRIAALTFFSSWPALLGGVGTGFAAIICWWLWYGIALWPNSLVGFDEPPVETNAGFAQPNYPAPPAPIYPK